MKLTVKQKTERERLGIIDPENRPIVKAGRWGVPRVEKFLDGLAAQAEHRNIPGGAAVKEWAEAAKEQIHTEDWLKGKGEVAMAAARGDREAQELHAASVEITTTNVITASTIWGSFFERRSLQPDELLSLLPDVHGQAVTFDAIGQDGGRKTYVAQPDDPTPTFAPISLRTGPWIEYPLVDLYKGVVKDMALAQFDLARDRAYREDLLLGSYIKVGEANTRYTDTFVVAGANGNRDIFAHPGVVLANLPTGNLVTLAGNTTTSLLRKELFDAIIEYCTSWGDKALEAGSFRPVEIIVSSKHQTDWLKQVAFGDVPGFMVDQVFENGMVMKYGGYTWVITGVNTISPTHGTAYVRMDQPVGIFADKPSVAREILDESPALQTQNKGRVCEMWAESALLPLHWRKRTLAVQFRTAS